MRRAFFISLLVILPACGGGGSSPSSPTPQLPSVAGSYSGLTSFAFPELGMSLTCPASTTVTQSGSTVSVAPIVLRGECGALSIPLGQGTIDATGAIDGGSVSGTYNEPSCGTYQMIGSGGFFGRDFKLSISATSATCYNFNMTATLTR
jgi:hypothetical protein